MGAQYRQRRMRLLMIRDTLRIGQPLRRDILPLIDSPEYRLGGGLGDLRPLELHELPC
jgi:hypothetical protein